MSYSPTNDFYVAVAKGEIAGHFLVNKFGRNAAVPNGSFELVSSLSAVYAGFINAATTVRIKSGGNAADTAAGAGAQSIIVEGIDASLNRASELIATNGASASSSTSTSFWRIDRAYVVDVGTYVSAEPTADIIIENTAGTVDLIEILTGEGQSLHCHYAIPTGYDVYLIGYELSSDATQRSDFRLCVGLKLDDVSTPFGAVRVKRYWDGIDGTVEHDHAPVLMSANGASDIFINASGGGGAAKVSASFDLLLVAQ